MNRMNNNTRVFISTVFIALSASLTALPARAQMSYAEGARLMASYGCSACHTLDQTHPGPSLRDIARRYSSDPNAVEELSIRVHNGVSGVWGPFVMPPVNVPDEELQPLIKWILQLPLEP